jgi:hypothetical protein
MTDERDYEVGYGRPPKATQFKKGQSGNPKGRPKRPRTLTKILDHVLNETIQVREGDGVRSMPAQEAVLYAQVVKAMKGDQRAFSTIMSLAKRCGLLRSRDGKGSEAVGGFLVIPDPMTREEWEKAAMEHQRKLMEDARSDL